MDKGGCSVGRKKETKGGCKVGKKKFNVVKKVGSVAKPKKDDKIEKKKKLKFNVKKPAMATAPPKAPPKKKIKFNVVKKKPTGGRFQEMSMGFMQSATPMNAKFNPVTGQLKTEDNYRMAKELGRWKGEKIFQLERKGNYFVGHGFTVGLLGKGEKDGHGHNIVPALKNMGEKYYAHYSAIGNIDRYIRKFLDPL